MSQHPRKPTVRCEKSALKAALWRVMRVKAIRHWINRRWINFTLATQIKSLRIQRGWTQTELANKAGIDIMTVVRIEKLYWGKVWPAMTTIMRIAAAFDCCFIGKYAPWSQLVNEIVDGHSADRPIKTFAEEDELRAHGGSGEL